MFCLIGAYSVANSITDVTLMLVFGIIGYLMKKLKFDAPPLVLAFVLGPLIEYYFKSSLMFSRGSFTVFFTRPISLVCLIISAAILLWSICSPDLRRARCHIPRAPCSKQAAARPFDSLPRINCNHVVPYIPTAFGSE